VLEKKGYRSLANSMGEENLSSLEKFKTYFEEGCDLQACDEFGLKVILRVALGYGKNPHGKEPYLAVLDFLLEMDDIPRIDKIDALELAGAILLSHDGNHAKFALAFQYWRRALSLRLVDIGEGPIYKALLQHKNGQLSEWCSLEDLQRIELEQDPIEREMQSLLVRLRIFSGISWRTVCRYLFSYVYRYTNIWHLLGKRWPVSPYLDFSRIVVDTIRRTERPHEEDLTVPLLDIVQFAIRSTSFNYQQPFTPNLSCQDFEKLLDTVLMTDPLYGCLSLTKSNNIDGPFCVSTAWVRVLPPATTMAMGFCTLWS